MLTYVKIFIYFALLCRFFNAQFLPQYSLDCEHPESGNNLKYGTSAHFLRIIHSCRLFSFACPNYFSSYFENFRYYLNEVFLNSIYELEACFELQSPWFLKF